MRHVYAVLGLVLLAIIAAGQARANKASEEAFYRSQITPMALNIYKEARGEKELGQYMVAYVTLMRAADDRSDWGGNTILGVVFKGKQFSWTRSLKAEAKLPAGPAWDKAVAVATWVALGFFEAPAVLVDARYYMNPDASDPDNRCWMATHFRQVGIVGNHYFYRELKPGEKVTYVPPRFNCS